MKRIPLLVLVLTMLLMPTLHGCSSEKDIQARRNFMMPEKTDLPRNDKYKGAQKKKTYKPKKQKKKQTRK